MILLAPTRLVCPNGCPTVALKRNPDVPAGGGAATLHDCAALYGLSVPLIPEGLRAEARLLEREDYENGELGLRRDEAGRPIMAVHVQRDDETEDRVVFAPCARAEV